MRMNNLYLSVTAGLLAAGGWLFVQQQSATEAEAQQQRRSQQQQRRQSATPRGESVRKSLTIPSQQELLELEVVQPEETRVGQRFRYTVLVRNVSDDIALQDIKITQHIPDQFEIESAEEVSEQSQSQSRGNRNQGNQQDQQADQRDRGNQREQDQRGQNQRDQRGSNDRQQAQSQQAGASRSQQQQRQQQQGLQSESGQDTRTWTIAKLMPGESKQIDITAASDKEGEVETCLAVSSYTPTLCLTTNFVKPDLNLVKEAPEDVNVCEPIEFVYLVENTGSGDVRSFTIRDDLPQGLETASGDKTLEFEVDGLSAGDSRQFVAEIRATEAGQYSSRAVAELSNGETTRSQRQTTHVHEADLAVAIDGPGTHYVNRPMTYTIRVTNTGDAPAPNTNLEFHYPDTLQIASVSDPQPSNQSVQSLASRGGQSGESRGYRSGGSQQQNRDQSQQNQGQTQQDRDRSGSQQNQQGQGDERQNQRNENPDRANRQNQNQDSPQSDQRQNRRSGQRSPPPADNGSSNQQNDSSNQQDADASSQDSGSSTAVRERRSQNRQQSNRSNRDRSPRDDDSQQNRSQQRNASRQDENAQQNRDSQQSQRSQRNRQSDSRQSQQQDESQLSESTNWDIGTLQAGETMQVKVTVRPREGGHFSPKAVARFICARDTDFETTGTAQDQARTEILSLAALQIIVTDSRDPVRVGNETVYQIQVTNEGSATDRNIQVQAELPQQLEFIEASGESQANAQGRTIEFEPVEELRPGETISWEVVAQATGEGDAILTAKLTSESYSREVTSEEPTHVYQGSQNGQRNQRGSDQRRSGNQNRSNSRSNNRDSSPPRNDDGDRQSRSQNRNRSQQER